MSLNGSCARQKVDLLRSRHTFTSWHWLPPVGCFPFISLHSLTNINIREWCWYSFVGTRLAASTNKQNIRENITQQRQQWSCDIVPFQSSTISSGPSRKNFFVWSTTVSKWTPFYPMYQLLTFAQTNRTFITVQLNTRLPFSSMFISMSMCRCAL